MKIFSVMSGMSLIFERATSMDAVIVAYVGVLRVD